MVKKYRVHLAEEEQGELKALVSKGRAAAYKQTHARILLLSDENQAEGPLKDQEIAQALRVGISTVDYGGLRWSGCAGAAWMRELRRQLDARSNCAAVRRSWMVRGRPT